MDHELARPFILTSRLVAGLYEIPEEGGSTCFQNSPKPDSEKYLGIMWVRLQQLIIGGSLVTAGY